MYIRIQYESGNKRASVKSKNGRAEHECMREECVCVRARETMHIAIFYALLHLYVTTPFLFFVFLFVFSPLFSITYFPLRSSLATFYAETDLPYSSVRPLFFHRHNIRHPIIAQAAIEPM